MPVEAWFPAFVFFEDVSLPAAIKAGVLEALEEQMDEELLAAQGNITASCASNSFHHDDRIVALLEFLRPVFSRCFCDELRIDREKVKLTIGRCWPVIQIGNGASGIKHRHRGATFSSVMYLQVPENAGGLEFYKGSHLLCDALPKEELNAFSFETARYEAKEDRILIFPSEIEHRRCQNEGEGEGARLAIALDFYASSDISHFEAGRPHEEKHLKLNL